MKFENQ